MNQFSGRWVQTGCFLLGFWLFAAAIRHLVSGAIAPIIDSDDTGAAMTFWGPMLVALLVLVGSVGGIIAVMLARRVLRSRARAWVMGASLVGFAAFLVEASQLALVVLG